MYNEIYNSRNIEEFRQIQQLLNKYKKNNILMNNK